MAPCQSRKQVIDGFSGLSMRMLDVFMSGCTRRGDDNVEFGGAR